MKTTMPFLFLLVFNLVPLTLSDLAAKKPEKQEKNNSSLPSFQESHPDLKMRRLDPGRGIFIIDGKVVKLRHGIAEESIGKQSAVKIITRYSGINSTGDINGDNKKDMMVILTRETGGSGIFWYAGVIYSENNKYRGSNAILLGDRINVTKTEIDTMKAVISFLDHKPNDPMSSKPDKELSKTVKFKYGELLEIRDSASIQSRKWQWEKTVMSNDESYIPKGEKAFTLYFDRDGKITITTDCNNYFGSYEIAGNKISFGPMMSTRKYCEGSQEDMFIKSINETDSYYINGENKLILQLKYDSGSILFK